VIDVEDNSTRKIYLAIKKSLRSKIRNKNRKMIYGNGNSSKKIVKYLEKIQITDKMLQKKIIY
jgi:UDP-N-acetylglucosamine 2-epimerase